MLETSSTCARPSDVASDHEVSVRVRHLFVTEGIDAILGDGFAVGQPAAASLDLLAFSTAGRSALVFVRQEVGSAHLGADVHLCISRDRARMLDFVATPGAWHLSPDLRTILANVRAHHPASLREVLHLRAWLVDLACRTMDDLTHGRLIPYAGTPGLSQRDTASIVSARQFIHEHYAKDLTLNEVARACGINRSKLSEGFRELFHTSVSDYMTRTRLLNARRMLTTSDMPIATVGYRCGYGDSSSFTRAFNREFGQTPSDIRRSA